MISDVIQLLTALLMAYVAWRSSEARRDAAATRAIAASTRADMAEVRKQTNHIKDQLVAATDDAAFRRGQDTERTAGEARAATFAAGVAEGEQKSTESEPNTAILAAAAALPPLMLKTEMAKVPIELQRDVAAAVPDEIVKVITKQP